MSTVFGIHFGSTNCCISAFKNNHVQVLTNDLGDRVTPCVVSFQEKDIIVGLTAKQNAYRNLENTIFNIKQYIDKKKFSEKITVNSNDEKIFLPSDIITIIFKKLMETAKHFASELSIFKTVISTPCFYNNDQISVIRDSATKAGFDVISIIKEPLSPILALHHLSQIQPNESSTSLVFRCGGTSLDITLVTESFGLFKIIDHVREESVGGSQIDQLITEYFKKEFLMRHKKDLSEFKRSLSKLNSSSLSIKQSLSTLNQSKAFIESLHDGIDFEFELSRSRLDTIIKPLVQLAISICRKLMEKNDIKNLDNIYISGGTCKLPLFQTSLQALLPSPLIILPNADELVAIGNAYQASLLSEISDFNPSDLLCLASDICLQSENGELILLFEKETPIPFKKQIHFSTKQQQQQETTVLINIIEKNNDHEDNNYNKIINNDSDINNEIINKLSIKEKNEKEDEKKEEQNGEKKDDNNNNNNKNNNNNNNNNNNDNDNNNINNKKKNKSVLKFGITLKEEPLDLNFHFKHDRCLHISSSNYGNVDFLLQSIQLTNK